MRRGCPLTESVWHVLVPTLSDVSWKSLVPTDGERLARARSELTLGGGRKKVPTDGERLARARSIALEEEVRMGAH